MSDKRSCLILLTAIVGAVGLLAGCGGGAAAPSPPAISVGFMGTPPSSVQVGSSATFTAVISNDASSAGVDWSLTCVGDCGSFSPPHTSSGSPMTYTAPNAVPSSKTVTITATSTAEHTQSVSANITITPPPSFPIEVSFTNAPPPSMLESATAMVAAVVSNDPSNVGVDWSVTCGSAGACGSFSPVHTASGGTTTYTAPAAVPAGNTVTITATSTADNTKSVSSVTNISNPADLLLLKGSYVFEVSGKDENGSPYTIAGQLTADGAGNITGGEDDFADFFFSLPNTISGGTYSIGSDGRGTITVNDNRGKETFSIVAVSRSHFLVAELDFGGTSTGTMDAQTVPSGGFSAAALSGGYTFALSGIDPGKFFLVWGGVINIDGPGSISGTGSVADINDGGTVSRSQPLSGSVLSVDSFGRADILLNAGPFSGVELIGYIADSAHLKVVEIDNVLGKTGGIAIGQGSNTGTFTSNSAVSGNFAFSALGISGAFVSTAAAGLFTANGGGNIGSGVLDVNADGLPTKGNFTATYSVDSTGTGRGTVSLTGSTSVLSTFAFYLSGGGEPAMLVELDANSITSGMILQQAAGPFSAASFTGPYALNFTQGFLLSEIDANGQASADGVGSLTGTADVNADVNNSFTPQLNQPLTGTFTANSNGRFSGTLNTRQTGTINVAFYIVNSGQVLFIETDAGAVTLGVLQLQTQPLF